MSIKRHVDPIGKAAPRAAPVRWLGQADVAFVQRAIADIAPEWSVELHGICAAEATLVLLPGSGDDAMGPSFMISQDGTGYLVDQVHWDLVTEIGIFTSPATAVGRAVRLSGALHHRRRSSAVHLALGRRDERKPDPSPQPPLPDDKE